MIVVLKKSSWTSFTCHYFFLIHNLMNLFSDSFVNSELFVFVFKGVSK